MPVPNTVNDTVGYTPRNIYACEDVLVDIDDGNRLDIYGDVYLNGNKFKTTTLDVRDYGAKLDGVADDTAAIQAALNAAGAGLSVGYMAERAVVVFPHRSQTRCVGLMVPDRVIVQANGSRFNANGVGIIFTLGGFSELRDASLFGQGAGIFNEAVKADGFHSKIQNCNADQFSNRAFILSENSSYLVDSMAQNCLLAANSLTVPTGVVEVEDSDCWVINGEYTASRSTMSTSGFAYAIAIQTPAANTVVQGCQAEISDHGVYVAANACRLIGVRADLNRGHGFVFVAGSNQVVGCMSLSNGREAANTYDGFNLSGSGASAMFTGCMATYTGNAYRYGYYDNAATTGTNWSSFDSSNQGAGQTAIIKVDPYAGGHVSPSVGSFLVINAGSTTWSVQQTKWPHANWWFNSSSPVNFTNFTNGVSGMRISVMGDGNTTLVHNTGLIRMKAGANLLLAVNTIYEFVCFTNGVWYQI